MSNIESADTGTDLALNGPEVDAWLAELAAPGAAQADAGDVIELGDEAALMDWLAAL